MSPIQSDALRGAVELLILKTLSSQPMHGWGIGKRVQEASQGKLDVNQGTLYPALQRLEHNGMIVSRWETTENNRQARVYELTATGRKALEAEVHGWRQFSAAIELVLGTS
jgi:transcriptional regulator